MTAKTPSTPIPKRPGLGGWRASLALSVGSLVVFFGLFELAVRVASPDLSLPQSQQYFRFTQSFEFELPHHQRDPRLGWRLKPGTYGNMHINSEGFRGPEYTRQRVAGTRRVTHLGDSCTMGFTIADDEAVYGARLATVLSKRSLPTETLNFGVDGYSSHQGRLLMNEVLEYAPDFVTFYFGYNDHHYSNATDAQTRFSSPAFRRVLEHSHAYRFLRRHVLRLARREARLENPQRRVPPDTFEDNLRAMVTRARDAGATPLLLTTPLRPFVPLIQNEVLAEVDGRSQWVTQDWWVNRELEKRGLTLETATGTLELQEVLDAGLERYPQWPYLHFLRAREHQKAGRTQEARAALSRAAQHDSERRVMDEYAERVRSVAAALDVELIDLARTFAARRELLFNDVVHPNIQGHRVIADQLAEALLRLDSAATSSGAP